MVDSTPLGRGRLHPVAAAAAAQARPNLPDAVLLRVRACLPEPHLTRRCRGCGRRGAVPDGGQVPSVVADLDGTLLRSRSAFPYYALVAFETGGVPRLLLLLLSPLAALLRLLSSESACARVLVFAAMVGARVRDVESAARAVLPRFYSD